MKLWNINFGIWRNSCSKMAGNTEDGLISTGNRIAGQTLWRMVQFWREICGKVLGVAVDCNVHCPLYSRKYRTQIISIVKPTRCSNVSNLFYFGMTLYMFRTVFPSIIRSWTLYIQQNAYVKQTSVSVWLLLYVQPWTPDDRRKDRPKHVECHSKIK